MDKLKLTFKKSIKWFNNLTIKNSYIAYITISLIIAAGIAAIIMAGANELKSYIYIYDQYQFEQIKTQTSTLKINENETLNIIETEDDITYEVHDIYGESYSSHSIPRNESVEVEILKDKDGTVKGLQITEKIVTQVAVIDYILSIIILMALPVCFIIGCIVCSVLFFKYKLNPPLQILMQASDKISENELDFTINYDNKDEMGQLCDSFEIMRQALYDNQKELWRNIEERKRLNSAFSHDLRTPLTVLKGYSEMLLMGLESEAMNKKQLIETITIVSNNIDRLEKYTYEMSRMQKLEDISVNKKRVNAQDLMQYLKGSGEILTKDLKFYFVNTCYAPKMNMDIELIMQVYENLLANAKRYATTKIYVSCKLVNKELVIEVVDDGIGFTQEGLLKATNPFFKEQENVNNTHFGLGLHICKLLTEKHGGSLMIANNTEMGAKITANFGKVI